MTINLRMFNRHRVALIKQTPDRGEGLFLHHSEIKSGVGYATLNDCHAETIEDVPQFLREELLSGEL